MPLVCRLAAHRGVCAGVCLVRICGRPCDGHAHVHVQVYGWSTSVGAIVTELATVLRSTVALPVREQQSIWDPKDSTDDKTLFILLTPQTVSAYPMYYVAYQTEQWGTHFLDEGSTNWGVPRGQNKTTSYRQVGTAIQKSFRHCGQCATDLP